eukprot:EG_transcript_4220
MHVAYLLWVGGPIWPQTIQEHLASIGLGAAQCMLLGDHYAMQVSFPTEFHRQRLIERRHLRVAGRVVAVCGENPVPVEAHQRLSPCRGFRFPEGLRDMTPVPVYAFPPLGVMPPHLLEDGTDSGPNTPKAGSPNSNSPPIGPSPTAATTRARGASQVTLPGLLSEERFQQLCKRRATFTLYEKKRSNVYKVCLTGGPCAGKTTVLSTIIAKFNAQGIRTYAVPEVATTLLNGGLSFNNMTTEKVLAYQGVILAMQLSLEQHFLDVAVADEGPALLISDRGTMDGKAYCDETTWNTILAQLGVNDIQLRDQQYDAVYHLVTAADGAEEFYGSSTNICRTETAEEARQLDKKTVSAYLGHPHLRIIDNSTDFAKKVERVLTSISEGMGVTLPTGVYRRYLVRSPPPQNLPVPTVALDIEIGILRQPDPEVEVRIVSREQDGRFSYFLQELRDVNGQPVITERKLTQSEYFDRKKLIDNDLEIIRKHSLSFTYNNQYFELGTIVTPTMYAGTALLYIESNVKPDLPPFIPVIREVTDDPRYANLTVCQTDYGPLDTGVTRTVSMFSVSDDGEEEPKVADNYMSARTMSVSLSMNLQPSAHGGVRSFRFRPGQHRQSVVHPPVHTNHNAYPFSARHMSLCSTTSVELHEE